MSGFSAEWLRLREVADIRSRNAAIRDAVADRFAGQSEISVIDLGCGTGSNLRAMADVLPRQQHWTLVDNDAALLAEAQRLLAAWADASDSSDGGVLLEKADRRIVVSLLRCDLAHDLGRAFERPADLVSAAALFDLVSSSWIESLVARLAAGRLPLYAALTYSGIERWTPADPRDARMLTAFHAHQKTDKGFGPSQGPDAADVLKRALAEVDYRVQVGESDWRLGPGDALLIDELAKGIAAAVLETAKVEEGQVAEWLTVRLKGASCVIGHVDLFALPKTRELP